MVAKMPERDISSNDGPKAKKKKLNQPKRPKLEVKPEITPYLASLVKCYSSERRCQEKTFQLLKQVQGQSDDAIRNMINRESHLSKEERIVYVTDPIHDILTREDTNQMLEDFNSFVVRSTSPKGIFCRAHCPSRPVHARIEIYPVSIASCIEEGLQPCGRCAPMRDDYLPQMVKLCNALKYMKSKNYMANLDELSAAAGLSKHHLDRTFKSQFKLPPGQYQKEQLRQMGLGRNAKSKSKKRVRESFVKDETIVRSVKAKIFNESNKDFVKGLANAQIKMEEIEYENTDMIDQNEISDSTVDGLRFVNNSPSSATTQSSPLSLWEYSPETPGNEVVSSIFQIKNSSSVPRAFEHISQFDEDYFSSFLVLEEYSTFQICGDGSHFSSLLVLDEYSEEYSAFQICGDGSHFNPNDPLTFQQ